MMQERDLQELAELVSDKATVLSLYLNVDPHRRSTGEYKLALRQLMERAAHLGAGQPDLDRVEQYFEHEYNWQGKAIACFSCQGVNFWRAYPLPVPVKDAVLVGHRAYLKPLSDLWDEYERLGVINLDKEGARLFVYQLGALEDTAGTLGTEVKRHKQGGWGADKLQRHEDEEAKHNLKEVAALADSFMREHKVERVVLSGSEDNLALFRELLPRSLQDKVVGHISVDMNASPNEIRERAFEVAVEADRRAESELLDQVITVASKGGAATLGLSDTLVAMREGRVYQLLVDTEYHAPGYLCGNCGAITIEERETCPYCDHKLAATEDAVNLAIQGAVNGGLRVIVMDHDPRLAAAGSIAAVLRY
jgi:peptide chain release factor subunit 1